ncbi:nuclease [Leptospira santarosai]|uniref:nuclease n=1 Tax=Leptospira santarosai TaxID=28183 RepID=UPI0024AFBA9F|nr:nuclease [Leptospira santarosai]MDI7181214.1 nuclease [Leptospira santarosai]
MNISEYIKKLSHSPLYNSSLSSKELFHSNFFAWLLGEYPKLVFPVLTGEELKSELKCLREKNNYDLQIQANGKIYIIENKVKSIPTEDQLLKIRNSVSEETNLILITFSDIKLNYQIDSKWKVLNYSDILFGFKRIKTTNSYHRGLLADYCDFTETMLEILDFALKEEIYDFYWHKDSILHRLEMIKLHSLILNYGASRLRYFLHNYFADKISSDLFTLRTNFGINNGNATIDVYLEFSNFCIGIQLENNQYRKYLECISRASKTEDIASKLKKQNIWFSDDWLSNKRKMEFCYYNRKKESVPTFVYQYNIINDFITFDRLGMRIHNSLNEIMNNNDFYQIIRSNV